MIVVKLEVPAHGLEIRLFHRGHQRFAVARASGLFQRCADQAHRVIRVGRIERRRDAVFLAVVGDELLVGFVRQIGIPRCGLIRSDRRFAHAGQRGAVDGRGGVERDLRHQAGLRVLLDEVDREISGIEREHGFRRGETDLRQLGREVLLRHRRQHFLGDIALVIALHASDDLAAALEVRREHIEVLDAQALHVLAHRGGNIAVLPRGREEVGIAKFPSQLTRAANGGDHHHLGLHHWLIRCEDDVGECRSDQDVDFVLFDQLGGGLQADVWFRLVVLLDDLDGKPAKLAVVGFELEFDRIADRLPDYAERPREARQQTDFHRALLLSNGHAAQADRNRNQCRQLPHYRTILADPNLWKLFSSP